MGEGTAPKVDFWTCEEWAERLSAEDIGEAVSSWADNRPDPLPETVTVYGYARKVLTERDVERAVSYAMERLYEDLDEEYGDPEESTEMTDGIRAAAKALGAAVLAEYRPWQCDLVTSSSVRVADYYEPLPLIAPRNRAPDNILEALTEVEAAGATYTRELHPTDLTGVTPTDK